MKGNKHTYVCVCGETFTSAQSFNGHKSHCKTSLGSNRYIDYSKQWSEHTAVMRQSKAQKCEERKRKQLLEWIAEEHTCENCGKIMLEKYGSGRFCSRTCANSRKHSSDTRIKISQSVSQCDSTQRDIYNELKRNEYLQAYRENPNHCVICHNILPYDSRHNKTCSATCLSELYRLNISSTRERIGLFNGHCNYKGGKYKNIRCDSSWELAFVVYCEHNHIEVSRNKRGFEYIYNNESHLYYPDFIINNTYIEIKNYWSPVVQAKVDCIPKSIKYKILYYEDIKCCIDFCVDTYGEEYWKVLYENNI